MLKSDKQLEGHSLFLPLHQINIDQSLSKEWLLSNTRGGYSCSTVTGCNTRRYHGLLTGSLNPPANRILALANVYETITIDNKEHGLADFEFVHHYPEKPNFMQGFHKDIGVHFEYQIGSIELTKSVYMMPDADVIAIVYDFVDAFEEIKFSVRPLVSLRDFHHLRRSGGREFTAEDTEQGLLIRSNEDVGSLLMSTPDMYFEQSPQWWNEFLYRKERERGQDCIDDVYSPGVYRCTFENSTQIVLWASFGNDEYIETIPDFEIDTVIDALRLEEKELTSRARKKNNDTLALLYTAADQFVVERTINNKPSTTILAGFPWFLDWGRDAFISLPGLLLATNRFDKAASVLTTFAAAVDKGMVPNRFDDYNNAPHYNSIDASLWFVHSAFEYVRQSGDEETFDEKLMPAIAKIVKSYHDGTRDNIHADTDGLITGGDSETQLTWMDAKCDGVVFTPRYGKAVEINALWYNALCSLADHIASRSEGKYDFTADAETYLKMAMKVKDSFTSLFWNAELGYLNDCILPDGTVDSSLRPNQTWAVSLPFSPLPSQMQKSVIEVVGENLLTPYGLRTLSPKDSRYCHYYAGAQFDRDRAYHQGTVWPHLIGPFIEGWLRVNSFSTESREQANSFLAPLLEHLKHDACLGSISEIFDAEPPHYPRGCFAQAWAVAEVLRCYKLINNA